MGRSFAGKRRGEPAGSHNSFQRKSQKIPWMKKNPLLLTTACVFTIFSASLHGQITITQETAPGGAKPVLVNLSGISGEAAQVIQFDLYVQGFAFTNADAAQYLISGSNNGNLQARVSDRFNKNTLVSKAYSGASIRRQAHAFA